MTSRKCSVLQNGQVRTGESEKVAMMKKITHLIIGPELSTSFSIAIAFMRQLHITVENRLPIVSFQLNDSCLV